jgi:hypothetical protein
LDGSKNNGAFCKGGTKVEVAPLSASSHLLQDSNESISCIVGQHIERLLDKKDINNAKEWISVEESLSPESVAVIQHKYMLNTLERGNAI